MGDTAETGARPTGQGSVADGTTTPTVEELMRENDSLKKSVRGLSRERDEWKVKATTPPEGDLPSAAADEEEWLTPKTARVVIREELVALQKEHQRTAEAQWAQERERAGWLDRAAKEIPESLNKESPVYKKAMELFTNPDEGLSRTVNGQLVLAYPNSEYVAFLRARSILGSAAATVADARAGAAFASSGGPSGGGAGGVAGGGEGLSDEEFLKLSPEERSRYQERKFLEKHGYVP